MKNFDPMYKSVVSDWHGHSTFARWLVEALRPHCFVEIGVRYGDSMFTMAEAMTSTPLSVDSISRNENRKCIGIDPWITPKLGDSYAIPEPDAYSTVVSHAKSYKPKNIDIILLKRTSIEAIEELKVLVPYGIDLLHIDGNHSYENVKKDFDTYLPLMNSRGVILIHDSTTILPNYGVRHLLDQIKASFPVLNFSHSGGLAVVVLPKAFYLIPAIDSFKEDWLINNSK